MFNNILFYPIVFLFGLAIGSFLNCVIYRLVPHHFWNKSGGGLRGRSYCPHCKKILSWQDLIPLLSFLILKGKCRYCQNKISWQYPLVELSTGLLFLLTVSRQLTISNFTPTPNFGVGASQLTIFNFLNLCYLLIVFCFLLIIFVYDLKRYIIPDKIIYPAIAIVFLYNIYQFAINNQQLAINNFLAAFGAAAFFLLIVLVSRGKWMGVGDIKLAFLMGLFLSFPNILVALFLAFFLGAIIGLGLIFSGRKTLKSEVPFAPFLVTGTFISFFWGQKIINWYLSFFL